MEKTENKVKKKDITKKVVGIVSIFLSLVLAFMAGFFANHITSPKSIKTTSEVIEIIEEYGYVVDENGNLKKLTETDYANALVTGLLDRYAKYYTKEEYQKKKNQQKGQYSGFGISIDSTDEYPVVVNIVGNSPAESAGIKLGDKILSGTANEQTVRFNLVDMGDYLNGLENNAQVVFEVERNGEKLFISVIKSSYKATYIKYYDNQGQIIFDFDNGLEERVEDKRIDVDSDTALIKIESFEGDVAYQLKKALEYMQKNNRTKLILDLRNNGGGYMDDLVAVSRQLIYNDGKATLIAYAQGKGDSESFYMYGQEKNESITDVVVLANEGTASASECLIGAMLCYGEKNFTKEKLILEKNSDGVARTYGKGIMQTTYLLSNGGAIKLTTAKILWPDMSTCIHDVGIRTVAENEVNAGNDAIIRARQILSQS